jgi:methyl-accepting chemotaxis protein
VDVAEKSGKLLNEIVPDIEKTAKLVQEISAASMEQNSGADQVNKAIMQLSSITQQNAAAAEEMATSSEELSAQAQQLREIISFFNIRKAPGSRIQTGKIEKSELKVKHDLKSAGSRNTHSKSGVQLELDEDDKNFERF